VTSKPYGGKLVNRVLTEKEKKKRLDDIREFPKLIIDREAALEAEKIAIGAFSPLEGFMIREDYESVLYKETLANGLPWTIPIVLFFEEKPNGDVVKSLREGDTLALFYADTDEPIAVMRLEEKINYEKKQMARQVYGTEEAEHPNVSKIYSMGDTLLGGKIDLIQRISTPFTRYELTPEETRQIFEEKKWQSIAVWQTRNPPHMAHEYIQRSVLETVDGLLIHPIVGELKKDDFPPEAAVEAYEFLINNYYPKERVVFAALSMAMQYAGPKAAVFFAIVRKNYGCTHFIVGRDMAGVKNYYDPYGAHKIFQRLNLGIEPILFRESFYCKRCGLMATDKSCAHSPEDHMKASMTEIRTLLARGIKPPNEVIRPEIAEILMKYSSNQHDSR